MAPAYFYATGASWRGVDAWHARMSRADATRASGHPGADPHGPRGQVTRSPGAQSGMDLAKALSLAGDLEDAELRQKLELRK